MISERTIALIHEERALWDALDKASTYRVAVEYLRDKQRASLQDVEEADAAEINARKAWHQKKVDARRCLGIDLEPSGLSLTDIAGIAR